MIGRHLPRISPIARNARDVESVVLFAAPQHA
jgi:hypothetical protein